MLHTFRQKEDVTHLHLNHLRSHTRFYGFLDSTAKNKMVSCCVAAIKESESRICAAELRGKMKNQNHMLSELC